MSKNNELAVQETQEIALTADQDFTMEDMMEELGGLGTVSFDKIKIPSGGGSAFEIPGDDPDNPDVSKTVDGVIVLHQPHNVYFRYKFGESDEPDEKIPDCSSADGKTGTMRETETEKQCSTCKYNQFGSAGDGTNSKACQNRIDLYILMDEQMFPVVLNLPATSIKAFKNYLKSIVFRKKKLMQVKTSISLKKAKSTGGIDYSTCVFKRIGDVDPAEYSAMAEMRTLCKSMALAKNNAAVVEEDADGAGVELKEETGEDAELPFI